MAYYLLLLTMDHNNLLSNESSVSSINKLIIENRKIVDQSNLQSQLLTIIKDLIVKNGYVSRKENCKNPFNKYGRKCFSQTDEDGITFEIIKRLNIKKGSYAEYGVGDGLENNTILLAALGWKGFWVGGEDLNFKYKPSSRFNYSKNWITLDNILEITKNNLKNMNIKNLDVISLDLDGNDFHFTKKLLDNKIYPKLFIVEYNPKFFPPIEFIMKYNQFHNWVLDDNYGASLESFNKLFKNHDYKLICCNSHTGSNAFFIKEEFKKNFEEIPEDINDIFMEPNFDLACKYGHFSSSEVVENIFSKK